MGVDIKNFYNTRKNYYVPCFTMNPDLQFYFNIINNLHIYVTEETFL